MWKSLEYGETAPNEVELSLTFEGSNHHEIAIDIDRFIVCDFDVED